MAEQQTHQHPIWQKQPYHAIHLRLFRNGDRNFAGKVVTLNKRQQPTFDAWLNELSSSMKLYNGVHRVFTPVHGHKVEDFESLEDGQLLVVAGRERFKKLSYSQIDPNPKRGPPPKYDVEPGHNRRYQVSGRYRKIDAHGKIIKCWPNGNDCVAPRTVLLSYHQPFTMESILDQVSNVLKDECCGPVEKLYLPNGIKVMSLDQILPNAHYVALRRHDTFKPCRYKEVSLPNFRTSPRLERKSVLPPLPRSNKTSSHSSPEHSYASNNGSENSYTQRSRDRPYRRDKARREEDQVFHARPVKHKRSSEKVRQVDYDQDQGGVFKSKQQNNATRGARQVEDSRYTKTDVPVDRRPAQEVEEEDQYSPRYGTHDRRGGGDQYEDENAKGKKNKKESEKTYRANSRRPDAETNEEAEREARERRAAEDRERAEKARQQRAAMNAKKKEEEERKKREEEERKRQQEERKREEQERKRKEEEEKKKKQAAKGKTTSTPESKKKSQDSPRASPINDNQREEELAAARIQAGYRGYKTRKDLKEQQGYQAGREAEQRRQDAQDDYDDYNRQREREEEKAATKIQAGYRGFKTRKELKTKQEEQMYRQDSSLLRDDPIPLQDDDWGPGPQDDEREHQAAAKIQAGFRGYRDRQKVKEMRNHKVNDDAQAYSPPPPEVVASRASENLQPLQAQTPLSENNPNITPAPTNDGDTGERESEAMSGDQQAEDVTEEEHAAATKIQATFRGRQTRKELAQNRQAAEVLVGHTGQGDGDEAQNTQPKSNTPQN